VRPIARWRRHTSPERGRHEPHTQHERRSGEAPLFNYGEEGRQLTVWPDGTLEAGEGRHTQQVSLVGAEAISVDYQGDDLPTIQFRRVVFAQQTAVTVRDRLGKTTQVSIRWSIPLKAKQELEEVVAGFVGKVDFSLAWAGARLLALMAAEPTAAQPPRDPTRELRQHAAVLQVRLAADPDDGAALDAARRTPNEEGALRALASAIHHRAELEPGFLQELVALAHAAEQSMPTRWLDVAAGAGLGLAAAAAGALGWFLMVLISDAQYGIIAAAVGLLVGKAVVLGSGAARSRRLQLISVGATLLGLIAAEYLIGRHFLAAFVAEDGGGSVPVLLAPGEAIALVRDGLTQDPWTLVFWALALWPAWWIPAPRAGSGQGPRLPAATGRRWQVTGLVAGPVVLVGLGVSAAVMAATPDGSFIDDLRVGQCYQQPKDEQTSWVEVVSCRQPHDAELFAIVPLAGQVLPAEAKLERLADQACAAQFRAYVGVASQATQLNFDWWAPTKESWASGDRTVLCELKNVDASRLVGSMHASGGRTIPELPIVKLDRTANVGVFHIHLTTMTCGYPMLAGLGAAKRGQYCIVELTATNARASSDRLSDANQRLSVATGESFKGFGFGDPLWKDELKPGQQLTTRLLFDLPRGVRPARLRLQADASQHRGQDTATINLPQH
jgi:hypothetical protein